MALYSESRRSRKPSHSWMSKETRIIYITWSMYESNKSRCSDLLLILSYPVISLPCLSSVHPHVVNPTCMRVTA